VVTVSVQRHALLPQQQQQHQQQQKGEKRKGGTAAVAAAAVASTVASTGTRKQHLTPSQGGPPHNVVAQASDVALPPAVRGTATPLRLLQQQPQLQEWCPPRAET